MNKFLAKRNLKAQNENVKIWGEKQSHILHLTARLQNGWAMKLFITATDCCRHEDDHKHTQREKFTTGVIVESFTEIFILHMQTKGDYFHLKTFLLIFIMTWLTFANSSGIHQMTVFRRMQRFLVLKGELERGLPPCSTSGSATSQCISDFAFHWVGGVPEPLSLFHLRVEGWFLLLGAR